MEPQAAPLWGSADTEPAFEARIGTVTQAEYVRAMPVEPLTPMAPMAGEPLQRTMPAQGFERAMPMQAMVGEDPFGTVPAMRSTRADGLTPAMDVSGVPADGLTRAMDVSGVPAEGLTRAMNAGVPAGDGVTSALKGTPEASEGLTAALKVGGTPATGRSLQSASTSSGSAGAGFVAIPEQYRAAAGPVLGVADHLKELHTGLNGYLSGMHGNAPWGNDDDGKTFANGEDGEPGYLGNAGDILDGLKSLAEIVETIGKRLKGMADGYENSEQFGLDTIGKPEIPLPGTGQPDIVLRDIANGTLNGRH
ncbi:hypothetical protein [Kitasatospora sp. NPDC002040]|uniref:hypothetical protein n=1 Tax=Kitasatospora sp. NPDC002040 TaxID=3154661 RepID=UPI00332FDD96